MLFFSFLFFLLLTHILRNSDRKNRCVYCFQFQISYCLYRLCNRLKYAGLLGQLVERRQNIGRDDLRNRKGISYLWNFNCAQAASGDRGGGCRSVCHDLSKRQASYASMLLSEHLFLISAPHAADIRTPEYAPLGVDSIFIIGWCGTFKVENL